ncbi:MAG: hypothetical protein U9N62_05850 [Thermotogota bacterium]|nr:hypothetical protein [Thermotogota bacterium]
MTFKTSYLTPSNELAEPFEVNPIVIEIRIRLESFTEKFKDYYR